MDTQKPQLTPDVIQALNEELDYQSGLAGTVRADTTDHGMAGKILTIEELAGQARKAWYSSGNKDEARHIMRKIAASACRALILYGCPRRISLGTKQQPILG